MNWIAGRVVLIPRADASGRWSNAVTRRDGRPLVSALIRPVPVDSAELDRMRADLLAGSYDGLVVTSAAAVHALGESSLPAGLRSAAVGSATADALSELLAVDAPAPFIPDDRTAEGLARTWPDPLPARILWPRSERAAMTIAADLRDRGAHVDAPIAYAPEPLPPTDALVAALAADGPDAALATSPSVVERLAEIGLPTRCRIVAIGESTARAARERGMRIHAIAADRTIDALLDALESPPITGVPPITGPAPTTGVAPITGVPPTAGPSSPTTPTIRFTGRTP